jgi:hypothetical protein
MSLPFESRFIMSGVYWTLVRPSTMGSFSLDVARATNTPTTFRRFLIYGKG